MVIFGHKKSILFSVTGNINYISLTETEVISYIDGGSNIKVHNYKWYLGTNI